MSTPEDDPLLRIAGDVADRTPVDWDRETTGHAGVRPQLEQLRLLEILMTRHPEASPDPLIGRTLSHFRIQSRIGAGGMGVVYRADDLKLRRPVALKLLPPEVAGDETRRLRFLREARAAAAIPHPSIAGIYEVDEADGVVFIAMELVEGETLRQALSDRPLPIPDALRLAAEIAEGLGRAHRAGVLHRDLKPDNIIVTPEGHAKILDFGLAKLLAARPEGPGLSRRETISATMTQAGRILGTTAYMSPEQARGQPVDARSDLFSFGTMLFEMLTGRRPFRGETDTDILSAIVRDQPPPASQLNAEVPARLDEIVARCLQKEPAERYQRADDLAADLRASWSGAVGAAPRRTRVHGRKGRWSVAAGLAVLLLAAGIGLWRGSRPTRTFLSGDRVLVADFTDSTGRPEIGSMARDAVEEMLAQSSTLDVIRGARLASLLSLDPGAERMRITEELSGWMCGGGKCAGVVTGRIAPEGGGYRIELDLKRPGVAGAVQSSAGQAASEKDILRAIHTAVLDLRLRMGESPKATAGTRGPTTTSLAAYQAYASARSQEVWNDRSLALVEQALAIDPEFLDAHSEASGALANLGNWSESRRHALRAYELSASLPERDRLVYELAYLDNLYNFDAEIRRLVSYRKLNPFDHDKANETGWIYLLFENPAAAEPHLRDAYNLRHTHSDLEILTGCLADQGKADAVRELTSDFLKRTGGKEPALWEALNLETARRNWGGRVEISDRPDWEGPWAGWANLARFESRIWSGRFHEAPMKFPAAWQQVVSVAYGKFQASLGIQSAWLETRRSGHPASLVPEVVQQVGRSLLDLSKLATYCVEARISDPLEQATRVHEAIERDSKSDFVREEIQVARGSLALIRGDARTARSLLEPIVRTRGLKARHHVLALTYEALEMWPEAAVEYDQVVKDVRQNSLVIPALWFLDHFRLARVYEQMGDKAQARTTYERFLTEWKDADPDMPEIAEAKRRLAALDDRG